jgi:lipid A 3-O-deacylase
MRLSFIFLLGTLFCFGQKSEIGFVIENDLFTSSVNDKYYTNGIEIFYRHLGKKSTEKTIKKIDEIRFGQYIFNPQTVKAQDPNVHDRPFAGYLFGQFSKSWFYKNESALKLYTQLGVVGPTAGAEEVQKLIHNTFNYKPVRGWEYQIHDAAAIEVGAFYSKNLYRNENFDFNVRAAALAGTVFSSASVSVLSRFSLKPLLPIFDSTLYGAAVNADATSHKNQSEFFFYIAPGYSYQFYDATIQGSMFNNDSPITWDLVPLRFNGEAGLRYRKNHLSLTYAFVYRGKEADNWVNSGFFFGSIAASWLF